MGERRSERRWLILVATVGRRIWSCPLLLWVGQGNVSERSAVVQMAALTSLASHLQIVRGAVFQLPTVQRGGPRAQYLEKCRGIALCVVRLMRRPRKFSASCRGSQASAELRSQKLPRDLMLPQHSALLLPAAGR